MVSWGPSKNKGLGDHTDSASSVRNEFAFDRLFETRYWSMGAYFKEMDWKKSFLSSLLNQCPFCPSPMTLDRGIADNKCLLKALFNPHPIRESKYYLIKSSDYRIREYQFILRCSGSCCPSVNQQQSSNNESESEGESEGDGEGSDGTDNNISIGSSDNEGANSEIDNESKSSSSTTVKSSIVASLK